MIDKSKVVFITNHFRRSLFFEATLKKILDLDYNVVVQNTGGRSEFGNLGLKHKNLTQFGNGQIAYDAGMVNFRRKFDFNEYEYVVLLDNDLFMSDTNELEEYLQEFIDGKYDFTCHLVGEDSSILYKNGDRHIAEVKDQTFTPPGEGMEADILTPAPHWENAYLIISQSMWKKMSVKDVSHHRRFIAAVHREGAKMGSHKASYRWGYTNWGKEWFHMGYLMDYYMALDRGNVGRFKETEFDLFRAGYFFAQLRTFGEGIYPPKLAAVVTKLGVHVGGIDKALSCWDRNVMGTCMEGM